MKTKKTGEISMDSLNTQTSDLRIMLKDLLAVELDKAENMLAKCTLEQRVTLLAKLGALLIPRQTAEEAKEREKPDDANGGIIALNIDGEREKIERKPLSAAVQKKVDDLLKKARAGRPKGALNKRNRDARQRWIQIFIAEYNYIKTRLDELSPEKYVDFLLKISVLVIPRETVKSLNQKEEPQFGVTIVDLDNGKEPTVSLYEIGRTG